MNGDLEKLERFEATVWAGIPVPELIRWAIPILRDHVAVQVREAMAAKLLHEAAFQLGHTRHYRALTISAMATTLRTGWSYYEHAPANMSTVSGLIHRALQLHPSLGTSYRHMMRVLPVRY